MALEEFLPSILASSLAWDALISFDGLNADSGETINDLEGLLCLSALFSIIADDVNWRDFPSIDTSPMSSGSKVWCNNVGSESDESIEEDAWWILLESTKFHKMSIEYGGEKKIGDQN